MTDHLAPFAAGFRLWRPFLLRGAGFPACEVLRLALPEAARQVDVLLEIENLVGIAHAEIAVSSDRGRRSGLEGKWGWAAKASRKVVSGHPVDLADLPASIIPSLVALQELVSRQTAARSEARRIFESAQAKVSAEIRSIAAEDRFREAVTWQNRAAAAQVFDAIARAAPGDTSAAMRKKHRLVASYLQRYCTKADSIGFFGPFSWGRIASAGAPISVEPGATLLAQRRVYFEYWGIDALAQSLAALPGMKPWMAPRRRPTVRAGSGACVLEDGRIVPLSPAADRLLVLCDGVRTADEIVRTVAADPVSGLSTEEGFRALDDLQAQGVLFWTLEVPVGSPFPERALTALLQSIGDPSLRDQALSPLREFIACKDAVARTAGKPKDLALALDGIEKTFLRLTGSGGTRNAGETYAGRTLLYEDCSRDIRIELGPAVIDRVREPLALLLQSARWFMFTLVARLRSAFGEAHARLSAASGSGDVGYLPFLAAIEHHFAGWILDQSDQPSLAPEVSAELQSRWASLLQLAPDQREQRFKAIDLAERVNNAFAAPHPGSPLLRYFCPDLQIAAPSVEAIVRGDFQLVVGEVHCGMHTYTAPCHLESCPAPEAVTAAYTSDLSHIVFRPILEKERHIRGTIVTHGDEDLHYELADGRSWLPRHRVLAGADLFVKQVGSRLLVCNRLDGREFDVVDFHWLLIVRAAVSLFQIVPAVRHSPRVVIDDLVIARECWRLDRSEIPFLDLKEPFDRFVAARRLAEKLGLPRFIFVKVTEEKKPFFVDLESSTYIDLFAHLARKSAKITFSEMLPDLDHSWLPDREGNRYICELRMAALDGPPT